MRPTLAIAAFAALAVTSPSMAAAEGSVRPDDSVSNLTSASHTTTRGGGYAPEAVPRVNKAAPANPTADIPWDPAQFWDVSVAEVEAAYNAARAAEAAQLSISLPSLTMPSQATWDAMADDEKALFLINEERQARSLPPFEGIAADVNGVAKGYADWLLANDTWGHNNDVDGDQALEGPWDRLFLDDAIAPAAVANCYDFLGYAENLAVYVSSNASFPVDEPVARSVYAWLYDDSLHSWGHRLACFVDPFQDDSGSPGAEGLIGIGVSTAGPYQGPFTSQWPVATMIVLNFFDPCSSWNFGVTSVADDAPVRRSELEGAYPNPFNPRTQLAFEVAQTGAVELVVYDLSGRRVRVLTNGSLSAGRHVVPWDGTDDTGGTVASGVYVARLRAVDGESVFKLSLVK